MVAPRACGSGCEVGWCSYICQRQDEAMHARICGLLAAGTDVVAAIRTSCNDGLRVGGPTILRICSQNADKTTIHHHHICASLIFEYPPSRPPLLPRNSITCCYDFVCFEYIYTIGRSVGLDVDAINLLQLVVRIMEVKRWGTVGQHLALGRQRTAGVVLTAEDSARCTAVGNILRLYAGGAVQHPQDRSVQQTKRRRITMLGHLKSKDAGCSICGHF